MQPRLAQTVAERIRSSIIETQLPAGSKLPTENVLMEKYAVSRSTIREAIKILQAENIVEVRHGLGSFVATNTGVSKDPLGLCFTEQSRLLPELMEVRLLMEPDIAALCARKRTDEDLVRIEQAALAMEQAAEEGKDYNAFDYRFHTAVAEGTHNSVLHRIFPIILEAIDQGYERTVNVSGSARSALESHREILRAIREQDAEAASAAVRTHILKTLKDIT